MLQMYFKYTSSIFQPVELQKKKLQGYVILTKEVHLGN